MISCSEFRTTAFAVSARRTNAAPTPAFRNAEWLLCSIIGSTLCRRPSVDQFSAMSWFNLG